MSAPEHGPRRFAVVGSPIAHSLSPVLHTAAYRALGIEDAQYGRFEVPSGQLQAFLSTEEGARLQGLSVTMPGKVEAHDLASSRDTTARMLGIANTLVRTPAGAWRAENHDVHGIVAALGDHSLSACRTVGVLGSGATAVSALAAASRLGASEVLLTARSPEKLAPLRALARDLGMDSREVPFSRSREVLGADAAISALAIDGARRVAEDWRRQGVDSVPPVFLDALYDPWPAPLAAVVAEHGGEVASGLEMLVHQADMQLRSMLGIPGAPLEAMREAARNALAQQAGPAQS
ncbi:shikimate dehydrogenase [Brachybacterium sp. ACRRE]|uniref:shikimate dehydrogenase n=1 Tax=Brachybacterium sp. ACRRE TaxID=2918184 RepID=UPI001EF1D606|nr:shikimate dehydrogenase [Brachybacterium sp. ACRRE]MCG7309108.1 shikimate dehydrogenase [Brachybacterium sp. ACRRE]